MRKWIASVAVVAVVAAMIWSTDAVTLQGERTVFTVDCINGDWQGHRCSGTLRATERYRYRALKAHREVIFWRVGVAEESGKLTDCQIQDGRNWICNANGDSSRSIVLEMRHGEPVADMAGRTRPFHAVAKWRWWLLRRGMPAGTEADA
jgi:hypothetical protein